MDPSELQESLSDSSSSSEPFHPVQAPLETVYPEEDLHLSDDEPAERLEHGETTTPQAIPQDVLIPAAETSESNTESWKAAIKGDDLHLSETDVTERVSFPTRPNKYRGPASTWRNWTAPERDLAASLDQLKAQDLTIHLYNTFQLKKRVNTHIRHQSPKASDSDESDEPPGWKPPKVWTAWPLPPEDVPREEDAKRWEEEGFLGRESPRKPRKASETLRALLEAQVLRYARERFTNRDSEGPAAEQSILGQASPGEEAAKAPLNGRTDDSLKTFRPVVIADDERASQILRPTITPVLGKLDRLLMGLHRTRSSYFEVDDSASDSQSLAATPSRSRSRLRKRKRSTSMLRHKGAMASGTSSGSDFEVRGDNRSMSRSRGRPRKPTAQSSRSRKQRLGLRDWSDLLGVASLIGWDSEVVERAASRCALLFGEGITFRTLEEGSADFTETSYVPALHHAPSAMLGELTEQSEIAEVGERKDQILGGVHVDGYLQPIQGKKSWRYPKQRSKRSCSRKAAT